MTAMDVSLTDEERDFLVSLLERTLKETRIEEHRTRAPVYRKHVVHQEELLMNLLNKLGWQQTE